MNNWRDIKPRNWSCNHFVQYMKDLELDKVFIDFYNSSYVEKKEEGYVKRSLGFRACSIDRSLAWALETKFLKHRCKLPAHAGKKHSELCRDYPVATWICPESEEYSYSPLRWKEYKGWNQRWVPIDFKTVFDVLKMAGCARTWFWELSLYHNNWRDMELYPVKAIVKNIITEEQYDLQWSRVVSHPYILEIDASRESNMKGRRDILDKEIYLSEGNEMIRYINSHLTEEMGISDLNFEWWFSGNGLYCITNPWLNSFINLKDGEELNDYFKKNIAFWNNHVDKLMEKVHNEKIKYYHIDNKNQHMRSYIKTPFSLHQDYDRLCLPLTCLFGGNAKIDLTDSLFLDNVYCKNLTKEFVEKYFRTEENGIKINNFLKVNRGVNR